MRHRLFEEINRFHQWSKAYSHLTEEERSGDWECNYDRWHQVWELFEDFLKTSDPSSWDAETKNELLYILARDNESESLGNILGKYPKALLSLASKAILSGTTDSKWQIAVQLKELGDKLEAEQLLEIFVQDNDEYVSRRALMTMADINSSQTEHYCKIAWNKDVKEQEYQRMAALYSLEKIHSPLLDEYLALAKPDGRQHILYNVGLIEKRRSNKS